MFARSFLRTPALHTLKAQPVFRLARFQSTYKLNPASIVSTHSGAVPKLYFTTEHEWIALHEDGAAFIGITNYAADALGDATFIDLPADRVEESIPRGEVISSIESVKSASDVYSPVLGSIKAVNEALDEAPELINKDPMGEGWIVKVQVEEPANVEGLMEAEEYEKFVESADH
jgi:glycine cleavage system H protein